MDIIYITNHLPRPHEPVAPRPWSVASFLAEKGHRVTAICNQRHYLADELPGEAAGRRIYETREGGMAIMSVYTPSGRKKNLMRRILNYFTFAVMAVAAGLKAGRADIVYARTPPMLVPLSGLLLARIKSAKFVLEIADLHPEESVSLGLVSSKPLIALWEAWENFSRRRAGLMVAVVPRIKTLLEEKGFAPETICVNTNAWDPPGAPPDGPPERVREKLEDISGKFILMYAGGMGLAMALENAVNAAGRLSKTLPDARFVFIGRGDKKEKLTAMSRGIGNCIFIDPVARNIIPGLLARADALFLSFHAVDFHGYNLPNKIFEYLGAGKPVIFAGRGDVAELIGKARCGIAVEPENPDAFAEAVLYLYHNRAEAEEMGRRGHEYVKKNYNRYTLLSDLEKRLCGLTGQ